MLLENKIILRRTIFTGHENKLFKCPFVCMTLLLTLLSTGCFQNRRIISTSNSSSNEHDFQYTFSEAIKQRTLGNLSEAYELYSKCLFINPGSSASMYEMANILIIRNNFEEALFLMKNAVKSNPQNIWYNLLLAELYKKSGDVKTPMELYQNLLLKNPENSDVIFELAKLYSLVGKNHEAIDLLDTLESKFGISEYLILAKNRIYYNLGHVEKIETELKKLVCIDPYDASYQSMLCNYYIAMDKYENGIVFFTQLINENRDNHTVYLMLAQLYQFIGRYTESYNNLKSAFESLYIDVGLKTEFFTESQSNPDFTYENQEQIDNLIDILLFQYPDNPEVLSIYADALLNNMQFELAYVQLAKIVTLKKHDIQLWEQIILVCDTLGNYDSVYRYSNEALNYYPNQPIFYWYNGYASFNLANYKAVINILEVGKDLIVDNDALIANMYLILAESYHKTGDHENSDTYFEELLKMQPNNVSALNNYSYYLTIRNVNLRKAKDYIERCISINPYSPSYLDTYAWVLYQLEDYENAKNAIEKSIMNGGGNSSTIVEHYGDILYKLNNHADAVKQWEKANELGSLSTTLEEKIKTGKLDE